MRTDRVIHADRDDLAQEAELARLEAIRHGFDPEAAAREATGRLDRSEMSHHGHVRSGIPGPDWLPEARRLVPSGPLVADRPRRDRDRVRAHRRACRLALILIGSAAGMSPGQIAAAMNMSRSGVRTLVASRVERREE